MKPDASLIGGLLFYVLSTVSAFLALGAPKSGKGRSTMAIYLPYACFLAVIGFGSVTDLGQQFAQAVRSTAREEGWYRFRADVQVQSMLAILVVAALATGIGLMRARRRCPQAIAMTATMIWVIGFHAIRGISLHSVDALMGRYAGPLTVGQWGSAIGLALASIPLVYRPKQ